MKNEKKEIALGLDISTACIGCCILLDDGSDYGRIVELTHVTPKVSKKIGKTESLFIKKQIFNDEFLSKWKDFGITKCYIEAPLLSSNNQETVATLLRFNGMISDCVYNVLGVVPEYISSYDARKYSFPNLMAIRKYGKDGKPYESKKVVNSIKKEQFVLFGNYAWDIDKKTVIQTMVSEIFPDINWLYDKKGELKKENFDACDAYVACLGFINKKKYGDIDFKMKNLNINDGIATYDVSYWNRIEKRTVYLNDDKNTNEQE